MNQTDINIRSCAIIGCGNVGAATAYALMHSKLLSKLVLIDINKKKAFGEAEDISHALPFNSPMEIVAGDYKDMRLQPGENQVSATLGTLAIYPYWGFNL